MSYTKRFFIVQMIVACVLVLSPILTLAQGPSPTPPLKLDSPLKTVGGKDATLESFIGSILNDIVLPIGAVVVVIFIIYSGFLFVTAQGNESKLEKAKSTFLWTVIGAAVLLGSWAISQVIKTTIDQLRATSGIIGHYLG